MQKEASTGQKVGIPTYPDLARKVAVVTGGSGGIGAATCRLLADNGARVGVNGRNEDAIGAVVAGIKERGGRAIGVAGDVTDYAAIEAVREGDAPRRRLGRGGVA